MLTFNRCSRMQRTIYSFYTHSHSKRAQRSAASVCVHASAIIIIKRDEWKKRRNNTPITFSLSFSLLRLCSTWVRERERESVHSCIYICTHSSSIYHKWIRQNDVKCECALITVSFHFFSFFVVSMWKRNVLCFALRSDGVVVVVGARELFFLSFLDLRWNTFTHIWSFPLRTESTLSRCSV